eukprot:m.6561 g.6561  ORF g.6561 m.6561 type:complete len:280 (-) comp5172_c0_seq1:428-1267(-)
MAGCFQSSSHREAWLLPFEAVARRQSESGLPLKRHKIVTKYFVDVIQELCRTLGATNQRIFATASSFFHRFHQIHDWQSIDPCILAATCVFLAFKAEEWGLLSLRTLIQQCRQKFSQPPNIWREPKNEIAAQSIIEAEFIVMQTMNCSVVVFHPYRYLPDICATCLKDEQAPVAERVKQSAWSIINDSYRTPACLVFPPRTIALAALHMAAALQQVDVSAYFAGLDTSLTQIIKLSDMLVSFFDFNSKEIPEEKVIKQYVLELQDSIDYAPTPVKVARS